MALPAMAITSIASRVAPYVLNLIKTSLISLFGTYLAKELLNTKSDLKDYIDSRLANQPPPPPPPDLPSGDNLIDVLKSSNSRISTQLSLIVSALKVVANSGNVEVNVSAPVSSGSGGATGTETVIDNESGFFQLTGKLTEIANAITAKQTSINLPPSTIEINNKIDTPVLNVENNVTPNLTLPGGFLKNISTIANNKPIVNVGNVVKDIAVSIPENSLKVENKLDNIAVTFPENYFKTLETIAKNPPKVENKLDNIAVTFPPNYFKTLETIAKNPPKVENKLENISVSVPKEAIQIENTINSSLSIDKPVDIKLDENLTKIQQDTFEIYKEKSDYAKEKQEIKDLDGNTIAKMSPREAEASKNALSAKINTDENSFELDDEDISFIQFDKDFILKLLDVPLPGAIAEKISKGEKIIWKKL